MPRTSRTSGRDPHPCSAPRLPSRPGPAAPSALFQRGHRRRRPPPHGLSLRRCSEAAEPRHAVLRNLPTDTTAAPPTRQGHTLSPPRTPGIRLCCTSATAPPRHQPKLPVDSPRFSTRERRTIRHPRPSSTC